MKGTKYMIDLPDDIHDLLEEASDNFGKLHLNSQTDWEIIEKSQPANFSWVTFDAAKNNLGADTSTGFYYKNNKEFKAEILKLVEAFFSDEIINHYREGSLTDLKLIIGSITDAGHDINEDLEDFKPKYKQKKS